MKYQLTCEIMQVGSFCPLNFPVSTSFQIFDCEYSWTHGPYW